MKITNNGDKNEKFLRIIPEMAYLYRYNKTII